MNYRSFLTLTNERKSAILILMFNGYIKTDEEAVDLALSKSLVDSSNNQLIRSTSASYEKVATTGTPKDAKLFWNALDQLSNGEADEIDNIFEFIRTIQLKTFNDFISQLPLRTRKGILFSLVKDRALQVN